LSDSGALFANAWQCHLAGDDRTAETVCLKILEIDPYRVEALHLLGRLAQKSGRPEIAVAYLRQAVQQEPTDALRHFELGMAYQSMSRLDEAIASYGAALERNPELPEAHNNLGLALQASGQFDAAVTHLQYAIHVRPDYAKAYLNLGAAQAASGKQDEAIATYERLLQLQPGSAEAFCNLGVALAVQWRLDEAIASQRRALQLQPELPQAWFNLGNALVQRYQEAVAANGAAAEARNIELDEAMGCYEQALRREPERFDVHWNRALLWLLRGNFTQGWPEYEWRLHKEDDPFLRHVPRWDGSDLAGRTILLHCEQGLGDTIHFIRYAKVVKQRGGRVVAGCQPELTRLLARCPDIDEVVTELNPFAHFDTRAPLPSLPGIFGTTLESIPAEVPYLFADPGLTEQWRRELGEGKTFRIGVAWQGYRGHVNDRQRSVSINSFVPLTHLPNVQLISLQHGFGTEQLVGSGLPITALGHRFADLDDTAAVMRNLDLVVTVDTVVAHLAGALAMPVWVLLPVASDWRWLLGREDSPWYPTMRLVRQRRAGGWGEVMTRVADELAGLVRRQSSMGG